MSLEISNILKPLSILSLAFLLTGHETRAQEEFDGLRGTHKWISLTDAPNSLYKHMAHQAYDLLEERAEKVAGIGSLQEWKERQEWIKRTLQDIVGPFPEKTPLNPEITNVIEKEDYRVEHIIFESRPGFHVTSSLFLPGNLKEGEKAPAIIYFSGHSESGYRSRTYQSVIINLVKKGFVVLAVDPIGQGERLGYFDEEKGKSIFKWPTWEHSYPGAQLFMTGDSMANFMIWDGIRAVDYLETRKEVDSDRIGATGRSGGGTQSAYLAAFDERIKAVAPENYITSYKRLYESMGPQDAEQNFFHGIKRGLDMADLLVVRAPKPALMITTTRDMFPIQGSMETAREVERIYEAYGMPGNFTMISDDAPHASTKKNREAMYAFFQKYLDNPGKAADQEVEVLTGEEIQVTETGQVSTSYDGESVFSLNLQLVEEKQNKLKASREELSEHISRVLDTAKALSGYREPQQPHDPIFTGRIQREGYTIDKLLVQGEGEYLIPYLLLKPEEANQKAVIYLHPEGKAVDAEEGGDMEKFVQNGYTVLAPDLIGIGELGPGDFRGDSYIDSISYNNWYSSMLIGRSIVGIQAGDVTRLANLLQEDQDIEEIYGFAKKEMGPVMLHAAAFNEAIEKVALWEPYSSYHSIVTDRLYLPRFLHSTVAGAIGAYDLPDLAASLAPEELILLGVTDGTGEVMDLPSLEQEFSVIEASYQKAKDEFILKSGEYSLSDILKAWEE